MQFRQTHMALGEYMQPEACRNNTIGIRGYILVIWDWWKICELCLGLNSTTRHQNGW